MKKKVYKCDLCGFWARRELKFLEGGKAICHSCGREMRTGYKDVKPLPDTSTQQLIVLRAAKIKGCDGEKQGQKENAAGWTKTGKTSWEAGLRWKT